MAETPPKRNLAICPVCYGDCWMPSTVICGFICAGIWMEMDEETRNQGWAEVAKRYIIRNEKIDD